MAIKLHRCRTMWIKGPHPCWRAQKALDEAGVRYELVQHAALHRGRPEVEELSGKRWLPLLEFEDGTLLRESKAIAAHARAGDLRPATAPTGEASAAPGGSTHASAP
jgi:glutathione S-transferase